MNFTGRAQNAEGFTLKYTTLFSLHMFLFSNTYEDLGGCLLLNYAIQYQNIGDPERSLSSAVNPGQLGRVMPMSRLMPLKLSSRL